MYQPIIFSAYLKDLTGPDKTGYNDTHEVIRMNEQEFLIALGKTLEQKLEPIQSELGILKADNQRIQDELTKINIILEHEVRDQLKLLRENQIQMHQEIKILQGVKDFSIEAHIKAVAAEKKAQENEKRIEALEKKVGI